MMMIDSAYKQFTAEHDYGMNRAVSAELSSLAVSTTFGLTILTVCADSNNAPGGYKLHTHQDREKDVAQHQVRINPCCMMMISLDSSLFHDVGMSIIGWKHYKLQSIEFNCT